MWRRTIGLVVALGLGLALALALTQARELEEETSAVFGSAEELAGPTRARLAHVASEAP